MRKVEQNGIVHDLEGRQIQLASVPVAQQIERPDRRRISADLRILAEPGGRVHAKALRARLQDDPVVV